MLGLSSYDSELRAASPERWLTYEQLNELAEKAGVSEYELMATIDLDLAWLTDIEDPIPRRTEEEKSATVEAKIKRRMFRSGWIKETFPHIDLGQYEIAKTGESPAENGNAKPQAIVQSFKPAGFSLAAKAEDFDFALKQDAWAVWEAMCWLHGDNPMYYRCDIESDYRIEVDFVRRAVKAGILTPESTPPLQWIEWASSKGLSIPEPLRLFQETQTGRPQEASGPHPSTPPDPRRIYPQAFGTRVTVAEMRERWGLLNSKYLDELAHIGELIPFYRDNLKIEIKPKSLGCEFGIPPDVKWSDKGSVAFDSNEIVWVHTLPDDAYYGLPFVLEYEEKYPQVKHQIELGNASLEPVRNEDKCQIYPMNEPENKAMK